jgi:hypothetical protein
MTNNEKEKVSTKESSLYVGKEKEDIDFNFT